MAIEIVIPRMGMTMEEGTLVAWLKNEGDKVKAGEPLYEIETDKTVVEIEAPKDGILGRILIQEGENLPIGTVIGYLIAEGEAAPNGPSVMSIPSEQVKIAKPELVMESTIPEKVEGEKRGKASPAARRLAQELDVDLSNVSGTGPGGRVVTLDVEQAARSQTLPAGRIKASPVALRLAAKKGVDLATVKGTGPGGRVTREDIEHAVTAPYEEKVPEVSLQPLSRPHRIMAERIVKSWTSAPHFYLHAEVDARQLIILRESLLQKIEAGTGVHITFTDMLTKLCALTLVNHPKVMAQWREDGLQKLENINVGVAIDTPDGLIVPVIFNTDQLGIVEIARRRNDLVERARTQKLLPQDLELGVFTITNLGMFRIDSFEAILNPPQAAILAVGRIRERALVEDAQVIPAPMMSLTLSIDHRVLDGATGARFLSDLVELIERPGLTLT